MTHLEWLLSLHSEIHEPSVIFKLIFCRPIVIGRLLIPYFAVLGYWFKRFKPFLNSNKMLSLSKLAVKYQLYQSLHFQAGVLFFETILQINKSFLC